MELERGASGARADAAAAFEPGGRCVATTGVATALTPNGRCGLSRALGKFLGGAQERSRCDQRPHQRLRSILKYLAMAARG
jgi:hypothetical protein